MPVIDAILGTEPANVALDQITPWSPADIPLDPSTSNGDHQESARTIYENYYPYFVKDGLLLHMFDNRNGMWTADASEQRNFMFNQLKHVLHSPYFAPDDPDNEPQVDHDRYDRKNTTLNQILAEIPTVASDCHKKGWLQEMQNSSLRKILFKNGTFHFRTGTFLKGQFHPNYYFDSRLEYDFEECAMLDCPEDIRERFFRINFQDPATGDRLLLTLAKGIAGDAPYWKHYVVCEGKGNNGKSTLFEALKLSFPGLIAKADASCFAKVNINASSGPSLKWAYQDRWKRIVLVDEFREDANIDGDMLKKIASGAATSLRYLSEEFTPHFLLVFAANKMPPIVPLDSEAVFKRLLAFPFIKQFMEPAKYEPDNLLHLESNANIMIEITRPQFQHCMRNLIIRAYITAPPNWAGIVEITPTEEMEMEKTRLHATMIQHSGGSASNRTVPDAAFLREHFFFGCDDEKFSGSRCTSTSILQIVQQHFPCVGQLRSKPGGKGTPSVVDILQGFL